jgi:copper(I)-binding protein
MILFFFSIGCNEKVIQKAGTGKGLSVSDTWIRPGLKDRNTAAFMNIANNTEFDDTLFAASSPLAKVVEIHETFTRENDLKGMRQVDFVVIPKNSVRGLKPSGLHIMLIGLEKNLTSGDSGKISLNFKTAGKLTLSAEIK